MIPRTHRNGRSDMPRPKTGETPVRHIRLGNEIWELVERAANEDGTTATAIVKTALADYMAKRAKQQQTRRAKGGHPNG